MKRAKVPHIPTTYRAGLVDGFDPVIAMTDYTEGGTKVALSNNSFINAAHAVQIERIANLPAVLDELEKTVLRASEAGFLIPLDAYFFIVPKEGGVVDDMTFAIADLDTCAQMDVRSDRWIQQLYETNIVWAEKALSNIFENHMTNVEGQRVRDELSGWKNRLTPRREF
jgi:hypothetical protein